MEEENNPWISVVAVYDHDKAKPDTAYNRGDLVYGYWIDGADKGQYFVAVFFSTNEWFYLTKSQIEEYGLAEDHQHRFCNMHEIEFKKDGLLPELRWGIPGYRAPPYMGPLDLSTIENAGLF